MVRNHVQRQLDFAAALASEGVPQPDGRVHRYTERVSYVEQLRRYHDVFPAEQVLVVIYDDFRADNEAAVRDVLRLLDVDATVALARSEANPTVAPRSQRLDAWVFALRSAGGPLARGMKGTFRALMAPRMRRKLVRGIQRNVVYGSAPQLEPALQLELRRRFKGEVLALSEYLGRDLVSLWGYDDLG
jgi:hypothetical protein